MKKISAFLLILVILFNTSSVLAESSTKYFTNNKALDATFAQVEKAFMASEQQNYTLEITRGGKTDFKAKMLPKMSADKIKAAVTKEINTMKLAIELKEEELGGLTSEDYKKISTQILDALKTTKGYFYYEEDMTVTLSFGIAGDEFYEFENLTGNFVNMGYKKDEINPADFEVKSRVARYINQSIQLGNKISAEVIKDLPEKTEQLFKEMKPSRIVAAEAIASIHSDICKPEWLKYDGTETLETIIEEYQAMLEGIQEDREEDKKVEYFKFPKDSPSPEVRDEIVSKLLNGELSEYFSSGFSEAITLDELARLYFESEDLDEKIELEEGTVSRDAPDYVKNAFIYGMIDDDRDLNKPLNRLEASRRLINGIVYGGSGIVTAITSVDCAKIPVEDFVTVATILKSGMDIIGLNFEPQGIYTKERAITEKFRFKFNNIRGYDVPISFDDASKITIGKNSVHLQFEDKEQLEEYIQDYFEDTAVGNIKRSGSYMRIDTGCALLEFFTPENGLKITFKNNVKFIDFDKGVYGPKLQYKIEPRVLKAGETVNMNMDPDSLHKKIYAKIDGILAKIIKTNMTAEQKVKAIHDFVVKHITYDSNYADEETAESLLTTIDKGRGVCGDYTMLFQYLCDRAGIPCTSEGGGVITSGAGHAWNVVFLNGQWKFVDTTWDDDKSNKVSYKYYLVDKFTFMKDHTPLMGVVDADSKLEIDGMNIKSQDELRVYLLQKFYWIDGYKVTFRMADKKIKPNIGYLWTTSEIRKIELTYDSKNDLYTVTAKAKK